MDGDDEDALLYGEQTERNVDKPAEDDETFEGNNDTSETQQQEAEGGNEEVNVFLFLNKQARRMP